MVIITYIEGIMGFKEFLQKDENARKVFGKREIVIIKKQLLGVPLTQSEKNRLSRDIRKKLKFIKEVSRFESEFELKKGIENKRLIEEVKQEILSSKYFSRIRRIVVFGSFVENQLTLMSDIDIAVEFDKIDEKEATEFRIKIAGCFSERLDIQVYNVLPEKIKKEIDENGKVIYEQNSR